MSRWTKDIFRWIRPGHLTAALKNPKRALREIKYRYTFTSKKRFITDILSLSESQVSYIFDELHQSNFSSVIESQVKRNPLSEGRGAMGTEAQVLYGCIRLARPEKVIETGVGAGFSTAHILKALQENNHGTLYSIDYYPEGEKCGWIIPDSLKKRWELIRGLSGEVLYSLLARLGSIDAFLHDSDHSYANMKMEFRFAWPFLKNGGILLAHDVGRNDAFFDFCKEIDLPWWNVRTYRVLAGFRKVTV
jgi:predicted O-methyltransferase YrrM